jgi:hypothetical protein
VESQVSVEGVKKAGMEQTYADVLTCLLSVP